MVPNADKVLEDLMKNDEKFREEYSDTFTNHYLIRIHNQNTPITIPLL